MVSTFSVVIDVALKPMEVEYVIFIKISAFLLIAFLLKISDDPKMKRHEGLGSHSTFREPEGNFLTNEVLMHDCECVRQTAARMVFNVVAITYEACGVR